MRLLSMSPVLSILFSAALVTGLGRAEAAADTRISGPHTHDNLSVYFVHGRSADGPVPLTLAEALAKGGVTVIETGSVNELRIENTGSDEVFIQAGDIVKGGKQDRVLTVSLLLPVKSGKVPIASFCVEQGRWTSRGKEDVGKFASAAESMPSRVAKLAMMAPTRAEPASPSPTATASVSAGVREDRAQPRQQAVTENDTAKRQKKVWDEVANVQSALSARLGASVAGAASATSLQLALENDKLKEARAGYLSALAEKAKGQDDIIGYVVAVNGRINSGDVYPSSGLFQKMWGKQLNASVTEAIGERVKPAAATTPDTRAIEEFLKSAEAGKVEDKAIAGLMRQETRDAAQSLYVEAKRNDGRWVHRNYLAK